MRLRLGVVLAVTGGLLLGQQDGAMKAWWIDYVRAPLTAPGGAAQFRNTYEDALLPPSGMSFKYFRGKIISLAPATNPTEIVLAVQDPGVADAKLVFRKPLPGSMAIGSELGFKGVSKSFSRDPFMITFDMDDTFVEGPELIGWTGARPAK